MPAQTIENRMTNPPDHPCRNPDWAKDLSPEVYEELLSFTMSDLQDSWTVESLTAQDAATLLSTFVADFVRSGFEDSFLDSYLRQEALPLDALRRARPIIDFDDLAQTVSPPLSKELTIEVHWPIPDRVHAFRLEGATGEVGRVFALQGPAIARCVGERAVGWLTDRDGGTYVVEG